MDDLICEASLEEELEERMIARGAMPVFADVLWGLDETMDEGSDEEDPEAALRQQLADKSAFVEAATGVLQFNKMAADLERARMMLEDVRSQQFRRI